jgi:hypothetical protein
MLGATAKKRDGDQPRDAVEDAPSPVREVHPWRYPIPDAALSAVWA